MTLRHLKIFTALTIGVWGLIGLVGNLAALPDVYETVRQVTNMESVPDGAGPPWRTESPVVVGLGVAFLLLGKLVACIAGFGAYQMLKARTAPTEVFEAATYWATVGAFAAFALMWFNFTFAAESVFFMFYAPEAGAGELAFRYSGSFGLAAILFQIKDQRGAQ